MVRIKRIYIHHELWEDYINGMWLKVPQEIEELMVLEAVNFTGDSVKYGSAMKDVLHAWPNTMLNSLTNTSINRRAFLGHCAVNYKLKIPEYITRIAWHLLTEKQRNLADLEAEKNIRLWELQHERKNKGIYKDLGAKMLF